MQTWLGGRYLPFWTAYLAELELTLVLPQAEVINLPQPEPVRSVVQVQYEDAKRNHDEVRRLRDEARAVNA